MKIAVIILTMNQRDKTVRCLSSFRFVQGPQYHIVLWDNGSCDQTSEDVRKAFPEVSVHYHPTNIGAAAGRNAASILAIDKFNPSHLLFIDNDTVVTPDFLDALSAPFGMKNKLAQTSAKIRFFKDKQRLNDAGGSKIQFWLGRTPPIGSGEIDRGQYNRPKKCIAPSGCMLVRKDVFQEVGGFDPKFDPYGYEDLDLSLRIKKAGYYGLYVPQSLIFHDPSQTFEGGEYTTKYASIKARNWFIFMRRHASSQEQLGFVFIGMPYTFINAVIREGKKGNLTSIFGLFNGMLRILKSTLNKEK